MSAVRIRKAITGMEVSVTYRVVSHPLEPGAVEGVWSWKAVYSCADSVRK